MSASLLLLLMLDEARQKNVCADTILERARSCEVEPALWYALETNKRYAEGDALNADSLTAFKLQQTARLAIWRRSAQKAIQAISMPCILLKGEPLGSRLMGNPIWRMTHDIDLWISQSQLETAENALQKAGWKRAQEPHLWATNQILLEHERFAPVELHWALAPRPWLTPDFEDAIERAVFTQILDTPVRILSDDDLWLHLLVHAHQHYFALKTVIDLLEARPKLDIHPDHLRPYKLCRLNQFAKTLTRALSSPGCADDIRHLPVQWWFQNMFTPSERGKLVFGTESKAMAAAGVLIKALSMVLFDGCKTPVMAALDVIFAGPHPIGARCHQLYDVLIQS